MNAPTPARIDADVIVVGAGIAGASIACWLAPHLLVIVLERESQRGYHATGRSAALFMESYGAPQVRALTLASRAFFSHPPEGFAVNALLSPRGALLVATESQRAQLERHEALLASMTPHARRLRARLGSISRQASRAAVFFISHSTSPFACASAIAERHSDSISRSPPLPAFPETRFAFEGSMHGSQKSSVRAVDHRAAAQAPDDRAALTTTAVRDRAVFRLGFDCARAGALLLYLQPTAPKTLDKRRDRKTPLRGLHRVRASVASQAAHGPLHENHSRYSPRFLELPIA